MDLFYDKKHFRHTSFDGFSLIFFFYLKIYKFEVEAEKESDPIAHSAEANTNVIKNKKIFFLL